MWKKTPKCIHPSIIHARLILCRVTGICWSLSQLSLDERQGWTLDRPPVHHRAQMYTSTLNDNDKDFGHLLIFQIQVQKFHPLRPYLQKHLTAQRASCTQTAWTSRMKEWEGERGLFNKTPSAELRQSKAVLAHLEKAEALNMGNLPRPTTDSIKMQKIIFTLKLTLTWFSMFCTNGDINGYYRLSKLYNI